MLSGVVFFCWPKTISQQANFSNLIGEFFRDHSFLEAELQPKLPGNEIFRCNGKTHQLAITLGTSAGSLEISRVCVAFPAYLTFRSRRDLGSSGTDVRRLQLPNSNEDE